MKLFECPECKAQLVHKNVTDGFETHTITRNGKHIGVIASEDKGHDEVYCSKNANHYVPLEIINEVVACISRWKADQKSIVR